MNGPNTLVCLSLESLYSLVLCKTLAYWAYSLVTNKMKSAFSLYFFVSRGSAGIQTFDLGMVRQVCSVYLWCDRTICQAHFQGYKGCRYFHTFSHFLYPSTSGRIRTHDLKIVIQVSGITIGLYYKTFRIIIYNRNDSTIVEPVL